MLVEAAMVALWIAFRGEAALPVILLADVMPDGAALLLQRMIVGGTPPPVPLVEIMIVVMGGAVATLLVGVETGEQQP